jgi:hypothetical protein
LIVRGGALSTKETAGLTRRMEMAIGLMN